MCFYLSSDSVFRVHTHIILTGQLILKGLWIEMYNSWVVEKSRYCWPEANAVGWGWVTRLGIDWFAGCWSRVPQSVVTTTDAHLCFLLSLLPLAPTLSSAHSLLQQSLLCVVGSPVQLKPVYSLKVKTN